jgi:hypothetical protein
MSQQSVSTTADQAYYERDSVYEWWVFDDLPPELNSGSGTIFRVSNFFVQGLGYLLTTALRGDAMSESDSSSAGYAIAKMFSSPTADLVWEASGSLENLTALVQGISDSLTAQMRTEGTVPALDAQYAPTVSVLVPFVQVRWVWLAYPLTLEISGLVFLAVTMYITQRHCVRPWRGHRVPLLLAQLDDSLRSQAQGGMTHRTGLSDRVGSARVRLEFDGDDGIMFRRVYKGPQT